MSIMFLLLIFFLVTMVSAGWYSNRYQNKKQLGEIRIEKQKSNAVWYNLVMAVWFGVMVVMNISAKPDEPISFFAYMWLFGALMFLISAYQAYTKQAKPIDYVRVYKNDPTRCGQCGYDVVHIESERCPECGWELPNLDEVRLQSPDVWKWWKKGNWEIEYLEEDNRKKSKKGLIISGILILICIGVAVWLRTQKDVGWSGLVVPLWMAFFFVLMMGITGINAWRMRQYYRRTRDEVSEAQKCAEKN
ncbi:hypothetical protein JD969_06475 [Planctomycetota bacterium]|nr:hypothetical protein JD969_06475 [Planctomycetota bacterium]